MTERKHIQVSPEGEFTCFCGNTATMDGFDPCSRTGLAMEPTTDWPNLYRCNSCMLIIRGIGWSGWHSQEKGQVGDIETDFYAMLYKDNPESVVRLLRIGEEWPGNRKLLLLEHTKNCALERSKCVERGFIQKCDCGFEQDRLLKAHNTLNVDLKLGTQIHSTIESSYRLASMSLR